MAEAIGKILGFENIGELDKGLTLVVKEIESAALAAARGGAELFKREWQSRIRTTAYKTGAYYDSIEVGRPKITKVGDVEIDVGTDLIYPFFLEYGTRFMSARPTMQPAFDATADKALELAGVIMGQRVMKAIGLGAPMSSTIGVPVSPDTRMHP